jgi:hypothetical protein
VDSTTKLTAEPKTNSEKQTNDIMESTEISHAEILSSIKYLKVNKPTGSDGIPAKFYKLFADAIAPILHLLFNECLKQGGVPLVLKKTFIKCLYKGKGKKNTCTNYRPISIISSTSKKYENIMYRRLSKYLEDNNLLSGSQHGYRGNRSTQSAVLEFTNQIRKAGDCKKYSGLVFVDFQKAFDMIDHEILIQQLSDLGIRNENLQWFKSYFQDRQITVRNGKSISKFNPLSRGTPQGSSLSGLLFSIYINLVPNVFKHCNAIFYADDLVLWFSSESTDEIEANLQFDIDNLCRWCDTNFMRINVGKTKTLLISPPRKPTMKLLVKIRNDVLQQETVFKYLGVLIDEKLNWNSHYEEVCKKMSERVYLINRHKRTISQHWLHIITSALLLSVLDYCLTSWGNLSKCKYARIDAILFRAVKVILPTNNNTMKNKMKLFEKMNWLTAAERYEYYGMTYIYKHVINKTTLTNSLSEFFVKIRDNDRNLRNKECFVVPRMRTEYGKESFYYQAIKV